MARTNEPLLPVEPEGTSRRTLFVGVAIAAVILLAIALKLIVVLRSPAPPSDVPGATGPEATSVPGKPNTGRPKPNGPADSADERRAKELYDRAEALERAEPGDYEKRIAHWREVVTTYPTSSWAKKADERFRTASALLQNFLDREFEGTRKDAQSLAAAGHFLDAVEAIQSYRSSQAREALKRRADLEIGAIQNASRLSFNETTVRAKELTAKGDYVGAVALFDALAPSAIPEVAARCKTATDQLTAASAAYARHAEARKVEDVRRAFRQDVAPRLLGFVRAKQYEDVLRELSAASAVEANAVLKDEIAAERASVADASSFWDAFLKTAKAKVGQEVVLLLSDGKRVSGKIARIAPDRIVVEVGDGFTDTPFDKLHADLLVGWTLGRALPAEEAVSYVKAALFFFCEGRDDLARLYLATAREMNGPADEAEKVFREGFLRAAMAIKK